MSKVLSQEELKRLLKYDPDSGLFTRLIKTTNSVEIGDIAGTYSTGYVQITVGGFRHWAHRLAFIYMTGELPKYHVDHINGNGCDNRWLNLRDVVRADNQKNMKRRSDNSTGVNGVYFYNHPERKYYAQIQVDYKVKYLGSFITLEEAALARKQADLKYNFHENHGRTI